MSSQQRAGAVEGSFQRWRHGGHGLLLDRRNSPAPQRSRHDCASHAPHPRMLLFLQHLQLEGPQPLNFYLVRRRLPMQRDFLARHACCSRAAFSFVVLAHVGRVGCRGFVILVGGGRRLVGRVYRRLGREQGIAGRQALQGRASCAR
jgi:hypothetical protein